MAQLSKKLSNRSAKKVADPEKPPVTVVEKTPAKPGPLPDRPKRDKPYGEKTLAERVEMKLTQNHPPGDSLQVVLLYEILKELRKKK